MDVALEGAEIEAALSVQALFYGKTNLSQGLSFQFTLAVLRILCTILLFSVSKKTGFQGPHSTISRCI